MKLAHRLDGAKPSPTLAITAKARELAQKGVDVVGFGAGEPDFDTPRRIKDAAVKAIDEGFTKYTPTAGIPPLREAIAAVTSKQSGLSFKAAEVLVSAGAKHSLYNLFQSLLDPGDEVIVLNPSWVSYADMVRLAEGIPVFVDTREEDGFEPKPGAVKKAMTARTRAIILNSPSNPTGAVLSHATLVDIALAVKGTEVVVVTDDIYQQLLYRGHFENILSVDPSLRPQTVIVTGVSKTYAMTGWRIGWAVGPLDLIAGMSKLQDNSTSNPSSIAQRAALAALTLDLADELEQMRQAFDIRRRHIVRRLNEIPGIRCFDPPGAFYAFPHIAPLLARRAPGAKDILGTDDRFAAHLLEDHNVAVVPGSAFLAPGYLRLSFATSMEQIDKGVDRIAACVKHLG
jgi:aspartate aminotransferase